MAPIKRYIETVGKMKISKTAFCFGVALLLFATGVAQVEQRLLREDTQKIVREFPAANSQELDRLASSILRWGEDGILSICQILAPAGQADDSRARFALGGLATYVNREGMESERILFARTVGKALVPETDKGVKAFLIRLLQNCGKDESVGFLKPYLSDTELCEPAVQAILTIGSSRAERALLRSLESIPAPNRVAVVKALGELQSGRAAKKILDLADSEDGDLRSVSLFALANIGDARADEVLSQFRVASSPLEREQAPSLYLLYARRLGESGDRRTCARICRDLIRNYSAPQETHIPSAALDALVEVMGEEALPDLLKALDNPHKAVRVKALSLAESFSGQKTTVSWIEKMGSSPPEIKSEIIDMLGSRGDRLALPTILEELDSESPLTRSAAVEASVNLGGRAVLDRLWPLLDTDSEDVIDAVKLALLGFPAEDVVSKAADLVESSSSLARQALIEILAERRAKDYAEVVFAQTEAQDKELRLQALSALEFLSREQDIPQLIEMLKKAADNEETLALQNALVAAALEIEDPERRIDPLLVSLEESEEKVKLDLLRIFPRIGGKKALDSLVDHSESEDDKVRTIAISALSRWSSSDAAEALKDIITRTGNATHRYVSLRGFVRLIGEAGLPAPEKYARMEEVFDAAVEEGDKKVLISGMGGIQSKESLEWVVPFLDQEELAQDAARAVLGIALPGEGQELGLSGKDVEAALIRAADILENEDVENQVREYLGVLWKQEGFVSLFNGNDLSGWIGDTAGYIADEGRIVISPEHGSGNLYTERQYKDFILRFEFRLTAGANNGLGIRTPLEGDPAYVGIELQILDNTADKYKDLKPYQYHGSLYGVVPAVRGFLSPVGEWNFQEVTARERRITVKLNGSIILDADIEQAAKDGTMDGREHPGLGRESGHIGFLGHGSVVEFRNIWIKEIER